MLNRPLKNLLFDLDGTLVDSREGVLGSVIYTLHELGAPMPSEAALEECLGPPVRENFKRLLQTSDTQSIEDAVEIYRGYYKEVGILQYRLYDGIASTLSSLQDDYHLFVCTAKMTSLAESLTMHANIFSYFTQVYGALPDRSLDNKADLIRVISEEHHLAPQETAIIGDRRHDIIAGKTNNISTIGAAYGYGSIEELKQESADAIIRAPKDLLELLR